MPGNGDRCALRPVQPCLVLYEALYGQPAFPVSTFEELASKLSRGERPPAPEDVRVPEWLARIIDRGLAVNPEDRFPTTGALVDELERGASQVRLAVPDKPSIVVLPFHNISGDPDQEHLADGVVESITAVLSRIRTFFVISRNSAFLYKGRVRNTQDIGRELGVAYLLEGSIQRVGARVRITVQLVEAATGAHLWADRYDGTIDEIFDLGGSFAPLPHATSPTASRHCFMSISAARMCFVTGDSLP